MQRLPSDPLRESEFAESQGNFTEAVTRLRQHLTQSPNDHAAQLRLGHLLLRLGESRPARLVFQALDRQDLRPDARPDARQDLRTEVDRKSARLANRQLAVLDEREGALTSARVRWERVLADDIDDAEAWARLAHLRPTSSTAPLASALPIATLVSPEGVTTSKYRLIRELGRGATATVYLVRDEMLDVPLALKVLHPQFASTSRAASRERFFAEARVAARIRHPGVVAVYDIDEATRSLAMEYIPGGTLRDRLRSATRLAPREVAGIAQSLLSTMATVHAADVVHGDLKPGNILFRAAEQVVLVDFGAAEIAETPTKQTRSGERPASDSVGTPLYLSPEQFRGAPPSPRTDLFAIGIILWELLAGRPARRHDDLLAGATAEVPSLPHHESLAEIDATGLRALIAALTVQDPEGRPTRAGEALALLSLDPQTGFV